jgi:hypothetical protein
VPLSLAFRPRVASAAAAAFLALGLLTGCEVTTADPDTGGSNTGGNADSAGENAATASESRAALDKLTIAKAASMSGYSREKFSHWDSAGSNCDVRDTVLKRDGTNIKTSGCNVTGGSWTSVYDDVKTTEPLKMDVDHMVPLANAWRSGAAKWTDEKRSDFANDLERPQLLAVSASSNRAKGDQDPSTWKPKASGIWCEYAQDWIAVKSYWKLTVTTAEKAALVDMLEKC